MGMSNSQLCHVWASGNKESGKGSNLGFYKRGNESVLDSYFHWPIATIRTDSFGTRYVLLRDERYSPSTSMHQSYARRAVGHLPHFYLPYELWDAGEEAVCTHFRKKGYEFILRAKRARLNVRWHMSAAEGTVEQYNKYAEFRGWRLRLEMPDTPEIDALYEAARKRAAEKAKQERERRALREKEDAARAEEAKTIPDKWRRGEVDNVPWWVRQYVGDVPTMLRLKPGNPEVIETSQGAEVPRDVAAGLWLAAKNCRRLGISFTPQEKDDTRVGHFNLDRINSNGDLSIGCHTLVFEELARFAVVLGLPPYEETAQNHEHTHDLDDDGRCRACNEYVR